ncbi:MAG: D-alanine--D-alanine ligase family protein [Bacillota bacterium]|nr:D-alanine--D-alanine ligase family protein [Bacillota bacterium]
MKINLAVLFGGRSVEHEVSVISAVQAMLSLSKDKYEIIPVYITKSGLFYTGDALFEIENYKDLKKLLESCEKVIFTKDDNGVYLEMHPARKFGSSKIARIDVALPVVHGTNVEDGTLQGMLQTFGIPYAGCDVISSAVGMDKFVMKTMLKEAAIPVLEGMCFHSKDFFRDPSTVLDGIELMSGYPVIVKPVNLGSSVGIKVASTRSELEHAIEDAASFSQRILVERAVENLREINCSVLGDYATARPSVCEEPVGSGEILSYNDKYKSGSKSSKGMSGASRKIPADLSVEDTEKIRSLAVKTFKALNCSGVARIDFLIDCDENEIYVNEINTIPGSLSFYLWEPAGVKYSDLLDELIDLALKREREKENLNFSYDTNLLSENSLRGLKGTKG